MRRDILISLSLFIVAFLIRSAGVSNVCSYEDEHSFHFMTNTILANRWVPTAEILRWINPFLSYVAATVTVLFEGELGVLRMISVVFGSLTVPLLYLFGKEMYDRKTGLLSALFLCFSAFHCLYSRIIRLEAFTIFFITAFLYFFWLSQRSKGRKSITCACIAGAMLGLSIDAKYISLFLIPVILAYVLWTEQFSFKALLDKKVVLTFIFAFLFFSPLLISLYTTGVGLHPIHYQAIERFTLQSINQESSTRLHEYPLDQLLVNTGTKIPEALAWGAQILIPTWRSIFLLSALLLFIITILSYLRNFITREERASFLIISISFFFIFVFVGCAGSKYYLLYSFPFYFVMLSHLAIKSVEQFKREYSYKNIFRIFIISLAAIMLFSYFITGITSPQWDEGENSWIEDAVECIKSDATKSGYEEHILIGRIAEGTMIGYSIHLCDLNATSFNSIKVVGEYPNIFLIVDIEKIDSLKPNYLIVPERQFHYLKGRATTEIFEDYAIVSRFKSIPVGGYVLKRKNIEFLKLKEIVPMDGKNGKISQDIFENSVPGVMKVGEVYTAIVQVKNTGDSRTKFTVRVHSDLYTISVRGVSEEMPSELNLNKGSTRIFKFKIVPIRKFIGELPITVNLYVEYEENEMYRKVDSVSDCIMVIQGDEL